MNHRPLPPQAPLGKRIVSQAGRHQFYTVCIRDGVAVYDERQMRKQPDWTYASG